MILWWFSDVSHPAFACSLGHRQHLEESSLKSITNRVSDSQARLLPLTTSPLGFLACCVPAVFLKGFDLCLSGHGRYPEHLSPEPKSCYSFLLWHREIFVSTLPSVKEPYVIFCSLHWICPGPWHCDLSQLSNARNNGVLQCRNLQVGMINHKATFLSLCILRQSSTLKSVIQSLALGAPGKCFSFSSPGWAFVSIVLLWTLKYLLRAWRGGSPSTQEDGKFEESLGYNVISLCLNE